MRFWLCSCATALLLASCSDAPTEPAKPTKAERAAATEAALAKTPIPQRYQIDGNDLVVIDVPSKEPYTGTLEFQRCFVWRDAEFKGATMSCPNGAQEAAPSYYYGPDAPGNAERL